MKSNFYYITFLFFIFLTATTAFTQSLSVSGVITDSENNPLPGVTIIEKGTANGVTSNLEGKYQIEISSAAAILEFSFIGYETQVIPYSGNNQIDVVLKEAFYEVDEVVRCLNKGLIESPTMSWEHSRELISLMDAIREKCGIFYPGHDDII